MCSPVRSSGNKCIFRTVSSTCSLNVLFPEVGEEGYYTTPSALAKSLTRLESHDQRY